MTHTYAITLGMHDHLRHMQERRYASACMSYLRRLGHHLVHVK